MQISPHTPGALHLVVLICITAPSEMPFLTIDKHSPPRTRYIVGPYGVRTVCTQGPHATTGLLSSPCPPRYDTCHDEESSSANLVGRLYFLTFQVALRQGNAISAYSNSMDSPRPTSWGMKLCSDMAMILPYLKSRVSAANRCRRCHSHSEMGEVALYSERGEQTTK